MVVIKMGKKLVFGILSIEIDKKIHSIKCKYNIKVDETVAGDHMMKQVMNFNLVIGLKYRIISKILK